MTDQQYVKARRLQRAGFTPAGVARELGLTREQLRSEMHSHYGRRQRQPVREAVRNRRRRRERRNNAIRRLLAEGCPPQAVAAGYGLSTSRVKALARE